MTQMESGARRSHVERVGMTTRIVLPAPRQIGVALFLLAWLSGWSAGGVAVFQQVSRRFAEGYNVWFDAFWLVGWAVGEVFAAGYLLYMLGGAEVISVAPGVLSIGMVAFGIGRTRKYDALKVRALRIALPSVERRGEAAGLLAFDYGARTVRFGENIDEAEASMVISDLLNSSMLPAARTGA